MMARLSPAKSAFGLAAILWLAVASAVGFFLYGERQHAMERATRRAKDVRDPEQVRALESLRLARTELEAQLAATVHERRRAQIAQAIDEIDRRMAGMSGAGA